MKEKVMKRGNRKRPVIPVGEFLKGILRQCKEADKPVLLVGRHGVGKSEIFKSLAAEMGIGCLIMDLTLKEPTDLVGIPKFSEDGKRTIYAFPDSLPTSGSGFLVFEELNRCEAYMRSPVLQLLTERALNEYRLPGGYLPVAAINPARGSYEVKELDPALMSRFCVIEVTADPREWLAWGHREGVHPVVLNFIKENPEHLACKFASPRTWKYVSDQLIAVGETKAAEAILFAVVQGHLGYELAQEFMDFYADGGNKVGSRTEGIIERIFQGETIAKSDFQDFVKEKDLAAMESMKQKVIFEAIKRFPNGAEDYPVKVAKNLDSFIKFLPGDWQEDAKAEIYGE